MPNIYDNSAIPKNTICLKHPDLGYVVKNVGPTDNLGRYIKQHEDDVVISYSKTLTPRSALSLELLANENFKRQLHGAVKDHQPRVYANELRHVDPEVMDLRDSLTVDMEYTLSDEMPVVIEEEMLHGNVSGEYPMEDEERPFQGFVHAKDQFGNEIELTTDLDQWSLNCNILKPSNEWKAVVALHEIELIVNRVAEMNLGNKADIGSLIAKQSNTVEKHLKAGAATAHFASVVQKFAESLQEYDRNIVSGDTPVSNVSGVHDWLKRNNPALEKENVSANDSPAPGMSVS